MRESNRHHPDYRRDAISSRVRKKWQPANRVGGEHLGSKEQNGEHLEVKQRKNNVKERIKQKIRLRKLERGDFYIKIVYFVKV